VEERLVVLEQTKQSLFSVPCFLFYKSSADTSVLGSPSGWNTVTGWRKLKDRVPTHENSIMHKDNYVNLWSARKSV
jgi:hypothetical protein